MNRKLSLLLILAFCINHIFAQNHFSVTVKNEAGQPFAGVHISGGIDEIYGITDINGRLEFYAAADSTDIRTNTPGYNIGYFSVQKDVPLTVILTKESKVTDEQTVYTFARRTKIINADAAVSLLTEQTLNRYDGASFVAAINTVPGVKMDERSPGSYRISIRGNLLRSAFGVRNTKVYLNGLPFTDASGNTYFNELAVNTIDRITIIKGPAGSMYGAGTGGVILLNNEPLQRAASISLAGGSYGLFTADGKYNMIGSKTKQSISFTHQQSKGYREQAAMRRDVAGYTFTAGLPKNNITANILYSNLFYETPGGLTLAQLTANPRQARPAAGIFKGAKDQQASIYLSTIYASVSDEIMLSSKWKNTTGAYFTYTGFKNPTIRNYEQKNEKGAGGRSVFNFLFGKWSAAFGGEYQYSFINTYVSGNRLGNKDTLQYHDKIGVHQVNVFAQAAVDLPLRTQLTAGISYNNFFYGYERASAPMLKDESNFSPQYIPRISLLKRISNIGSAYISYSKGYSPPTIDEIHASNGIFNKALNAEEGTNYEAGVKMNIHNVFSADVSYYIFHLNNTIVSRRDVSGADYYVNAGKTDQKGLEFSLGYTPVMHSLSFVKKIKLQATGTAVNARFEDYQQGTAKYSGNRLTGTSPFIFSMMGDIETAPGIYSNITYTYTDKIPLNDANTFFAKPYNLLFIKLGIQKKLSSKLSADVFVTAQKSFNDNYSLGNDLNADANRFFNPAAMQVFTGGIKLGFMK